MAIIADGATLWARRCCGFCFIVHTALVALANEMLSRLHVDVRVSSCVDMNSLLFTTLYEGLCAEHVKGKTCSITVWMCCVSSSHRYDIVQVLCCFFAPRALRS